ncbi:P-loop containing nucleoside triphosphate hydrolase protein [Suillus fuscotomentosus]|uniref:P-loop containing nucleoside triphosphate hydrolase protein n=1 Tax=Suillus fuscotomentosus TaxID=1912939 RepID=A0AAD4HJC3_9AGAM|nr:P-loop containing nucleoside triphosphate hydrolase protein [Suillus fuscotomentosus]KAG1897599.1 P-loop containing nucleoside triphosphate hydrolase protein [Suillus fuscotomentosus]
MLQNNLGELRQSAAEDSRRVEEARLTAEKKWFKGVRPECHPSEEDINQMKAVYHYNLGFIHIAVVGSAGAGKSSFINAVRGISTNHTMAAPMGTTEITRTVTRYPDLCPNSRTIWYDVPGSGTLEVSDWRYFNNMGLYIFDCIIVVIDNHFLDSDLAILRTCEQFKNIEAFLVCSKSDQHIKNMVSQKMGFDPWDPDSDMDDTARSLFRLMRLQEHQRFIDETHQNIQMNLEKAKFPPKNVYIVCNDTMHQTVCTGKTHPTKAIDEAKLLDDVKEFTLKRLQLGCSK